MSIRLSEGAEHGLLDRVLVRAILDANAMLDGDISRPQCLLAPVNGVADVMEETARQADPLSAAWRRITPCMTYPL